MGTFSAIPINIQFPENYDDEMMVMMISFISMYKHAKGYGESALLALQVFVTREVILLRCGHLAPCPYAARRASKKQTFQKF